MISEWLLPSEPAKQSRRRSTLRMVGQVFQSRNGTWCKHSLLVRSQSSGLTVDYRAATCSGPWVGRYFLVGYEAVGHTDAANSTTAVNGVIEYAEPR
jgi:hypothetical protein